MVKDLESIAWELLWQQMDPEIPSISIVELGIVRQVKVNGNRILVTITTTFSGCPAKEIIQQSIRQIFTERSLWVELKLELSPPWTVNDMHPSCFSKLKAIGIAPPVPEGVLIRCTRCESEQTEAVSHFGATACKAHYRCLKCLEVFEYFKGLGKLLLTPQTPQSKYLSNLTKKNEWIANILSHCCVYKNKALKIFKD